MNRASVIRIRRVLAALGCLVPLAGCGNDFTPGSHVGRLRLLALAADQPFARPGEQVSLQLLAANPPGSASQPPHFAWASCARPAGTSVDSCLRALDRPAWTDFDPSTPLAFTLPEDALSGLPEAAPPSVFYGVVVVACPGAIEGGETNGLPLRCRDDMGDVLPIDEFDVGMKRIYVRERDRNANPRITALRWDGRDWPEDEIPTAAACDASHDDIDDCPESLRHRIGVQTRAAESGTNESGSAFVEQLIVSAYATHGLFREEVRIAEDAEHVWAAQNTGEGDVASLWFVVRDDRGGVGWAQRQVRVR